MQAHETRVLASVGALLAAAIVAGDATAAEPTAFEKLATHPDTVVAVSRDVGALASVDSTVAVTMLVTSTRADATQRVRGVRFDLTNNGGTERVYLDERQLAKLETELSLMARFSAANEADLEGGPRGMRVQGTESCWMPNPVQRILCPEAQWAPAWTGLRLWTFGGAVYDFRDRTAVELRELVERAVTELGEL